MSIGEGPYDIALAFGQIWGLVRVLNEYHDEKECCRWMDSGDHLGRGSRARRMQGERFAGLALLERHTHGPFELWQSHSC